MPRSRRISVGREMRVVRRSLSSLAAALQRLAEASSAAAGPERRRGRKLKLSPARRAALKLQGQYMGYLRNLAPRLKAQVKSARGAKGIRKAIALAKRLAKG
jgi:hypothetical protein